MTSVGFFYCKPICQATFNLFPPLWFDDSAALSGCTVESFLRQALYWYNGGGALFDSYQATSSLDSRDHYCFFNLLGTKPYVQFLYQKIMHEKPVVKICVWSQAFFFLLPLMEHGCLFTEWDNPVGNWCHWMLPNIEMILYCFTVNKSHQNKSAMHWSY